MKEQGPHKGWRKETFPQALLSALTGKMKRRKQQQGQRLLHSSEWAWTWPLRTRGAHRASHCPPGRWFPSAGFLTRSSQENLDRDAEFAVVDVDTGVWEATVHGGWCPVPGEAEQRGADLRQKHSPKWPSHLRALSRPGRRRQPPAAGEKQRTGDRERISSSTG